MNLDGFRALSAHQRAMISIAVLLDGHEASLYLSNDSLDGELLGKVAGEFASLAPEFRNSVAGHQLRVALEEIQERSEEA